MPGGNPGIPEAESGNFIWSRRDLVSLAGWGAILTCFAVAGGAIVDALPIYNCGHAGKGPHGASMTPACPQVPSWEGEWCVGGEGARGAHTGVPAIRQRGNFSAGLRN